MNNKANNVNLSTDGELSAQQRARISQSFRAAKLRLERKRPRFESSDQLQKNRKCGDENENGSLFRVREIKRVPLSEISSNVSSPVLLRECNFINKNNDCGSEIRPSHGNQAKPNNIISSGGVSSYGNQAKRNSIISSGGVSSYGNQAKHNIIIGSGGVSSYGNQAKHNSIIGSRGVSSYGNQAKHNNTTPSGCISSYRIGPIDGVLGVEKLGPSRLDGSDINSCIADLRQPDFSNGFDLNISTNSVEPVDSPDLNVSLTMDTFPDDDFDESIFAQIDYLCEQKSAGISDRKESVVNKVEIETDIKLFQDDNTIQCLDVSDQKLKSEEILNSGVDQESVVNKVEIETDIKLFQNDNTIQCLDVSDQKLKSEEILNSGVDQVCGVKEFIKSEDRFTKNMPEEYAKYIQSLNDRQQEAACSDISTPLVIVAGPGSGKTSTMVGRVLMLLNEGIDPSHILAMTFTTAAAAEMRERIAAVAGKASSKELTISTFHSFSLQLCRLHAEKLDRTPEFLIYGHGQQRKAIIEAVRLLEDGKRRASHDLCKLTELSDVNSPKHFKDKSKKWLKFVTQAKASGRSSEDFRKMGNETGAIILEKYNDILKSCNALDYHDFISCSVKLLTDFPEVLKECQESWKAVVIDEFQDTSSMQYDFLRILASHKRITIVGDEDQSIFGFNGADVSGFDSFRKDFPLCKEVRLNKNYRSTRCIVEAASFLIRNNSKRCIRKDALTDNSSGSKITIKECRNEEAQCAFVVDKILEIASDGSSTKCSYGNIAVLYRRQVTGKIFQTAFRNRKIPFNTHGVAFYRKKVVRSIIAMLSSTLPGCDDGAFRRVFKAILPFEKEEKKKVIDHIDKVSTVRRCSFISAAGDIFSAKISGTFKRSQLTQGRKVLLTLDMISKLVQREESLSAVITSVTNMIPQKYLLEQRAVLDADGGKLLNEDNDLRPVLQYLLDDVSVFLTTIYNIKEGGHDNITEGKGCMTALKAFIDYISVRERENFRSRKDENENSVTLTTIHQSKGLEWDTVFIVKTNEAEIPLLHEHNGTLNENGNSVEEERRLLYVAMTRARKKLFMLYLLMDSNWQVLQPSRFIREIPHHLVVNQEELTSVNPESNYSEIKLEAPQVSVGLKSESPGTYSMQNVSLDNLFNEASRELSEVAENYNSSIFLKRFNTEHRGVVSHLFHQWAKKPAFHDPKRLLNKVSFVIDERLRVPKSTHKDVLRELKSCLKSDEAYQFAVSVLRWEQIPADQRAHIMREKQEHFQKLRIESAMGSSEATPKQIAYLQSLGCMTVPTTRLHASRLIEEYKSL